jgi:hypothetical protein
MPWPQSRHPKQSSFSQSPNAPFIRSLADPQSFLSLKSSIQSVIGHPDLFSHNSWFTINAGRTITNSFHNGQNSLIPKQDVRVDWILLMLVPDFMVISLLVNV